MNFGQDSSNGSSTGKDYSRLSLSRDLSGASKRNLWWAMCILAAVLVVEVVGGIMSGSLALIADAGHLAANAASVGLALLAMHYAEREATAERTFGYQRLEILAALLTALVLWAIVAGILIEAYHRFGEEQLHVEAGMMLIIGGIGLLANMTAMVILSRSVKHSANVEGAFQHVRADMVGSVAVVITGALLWQFAGDNPSWYLADPMVSVVLSLIILRATWGLLRRVIHVLLEGTPAHIDVHELCMRIETVEHVTLIHDIHVWSISEGSEMMTAHIIIDREYKGPPDDILADLRRIVTGEFGIGHMTIQLEHSARNCKEETHHVDHLLAEWDAVKHRRRMQ